MKKKLIRSYGGAMLSAVPIARKNVQLSEDQGEVELVLVPYMPASPFKTADTDMRRDWTWVYDQASIVDEYNSRARKGSVGIEHGRTGDTKSRGVLWELTYAAREPGFGMEPGLTYAWVYPSEIGKKELADRAWLYTSLEASGSFDPATKTLTLKKATGHTFTNTPATEMPMNLTESGEPDFGAEVDAEDVPDGPGYTSEQSQLDDEMLEKILKAFGLTAQADEATVMAAVDAAVAAKAAAVATEQSLTEVKAELTAAQTQVEALATVQAELTTAQGQVQALTVELTTTKEQLAQLTTEQTTVKLTAAVDSLIASRKATPAQRDSLIALATADLGAFQKFAAAAVEVVAGETTPHVAAAATEETVPEDVLSYVTTVVGADAKAYLRGKA